jgi:uncharacterized membrane protein
MPRWAAAVLTLAYPALIYWGSQYWPPPVVALLVAPLLLLSAHRGLGGKWLLLGVAGLVALAIGLGHSLPLKLYPVLVNGGLLALFAASLRRPPSIAERFARLRQPDLPPPAVAYTRRVTAAWCAFFIGNGSLALGTAIWGSDQVWFWYNGVCAYVLIGAMFAGERLVRRRILREGQ